MNNLKLSKRLTAAAQLCRQNSFIADVGTDHAYLPIYLWQEGMIRGGVVSDINKGPIDRARAHIAEYGASDSFTALLCDGLSDLEDYRPEDIFILGMGGELIARIISDAPWTKNENIRLILQPMTHPELLRKFLWDNGYEITEERLIKEEKLYQLMAVEYSGRKIDYNQTELMFGKINIARKEDLLLEFLEHTQKVMSDRIRGKQSAGADVSFEENLIKEIEELK